MATFFKRSRIWAVEYQWEGRTRHWLKALPEHADATALLRGELQDLYGERARLVSVRPATAEEEQDYVRGELPRNAYCPTGKLPVGPVHEPAAEVRPGPARPAPPGPRRT